MPTSRLNEKYAHAGLLINSNRSFLQVKNQIKQFLDRSVLIFRVAMQGGPSAHVGLPVIVKRCASPHNGALCGAVV